jgi:isoaspartyl peptidase/L-asparaginase-like protein (Ntn-hydrolase superfamily)
MLISGNKNVINVFDKLNSFKPKHKEQAPKDTIGCVAITNDSISLGTSSGGPKCKMEGRIGSVYNIIKAAIYGAGAYTHKSDDAMIGCVASGEGELMMQSLICRTWVDYILKDQDYFQEHIPPFMIEAQYGIVSVDNLDASMRVLIYID